MKLVGRHQVIGMIKFMSIGRSERKLHKINSHLILMMVLMTIKMDVIFLQ